MKIEIKLIASRKETVEGFPLVIEIAHQNKRKQKTICFCKENHFVAANKMINEKHPDYDILAPKIMSLKLRARQIVLSGSTDVEKAFRVLFADDNDKVMFLGFGEKLITDMKVIAAQLGKANKLQAQNKQLGNLRVYENVLAQFRDFGRSNR